MSICQHAMYDNHEIVQIFVVSRYKVPYIHTKVNKNKCLTY